MTTVSSFSPLLSGLSELHRCAIQAMLESEECNLRCQLIFGSTKLDPCPNCYQLPNGASANRYKPGGPIPFSGGLCVFCNGKGTVKITPKTEDINLVVIFDAKHWIDIGGVVATAAGKIQTISVLSDTLSKIKRATSIVIGTDVENYEKHMYQRDGEPCPCGFGANNFIVTMWKKYA